MNRLTMGSIMRACGRAGILMGNGLKYIGDFDCDDPSSGAGRHLLPKGRRSIRCTTSTLAGEVLSFPLLPLGRRWRVAPDEGGFPPKRDM
jgi:hypothetical protein